MKHLVCGEVSTDRCYSCWDFSLSPFGVKDQSVRCVLLSLLEVKMSLLHTAGVCYQQCDEYVWEL